MSRPAIYTPEEAAERRRERVRISVAKHSERLNAMSPLEQAAWKARESLGENYDPYTTEERESLNRIRRLRQALEVETANLNTRMTRRYRQALADNPKVIALLAELENGKEVRVQIKPH